MAGAIALEAIRKLPGFGGWRAVAAQFPTGADGAAPSIAKRNGLFERPLVAGLVLFPARGPKRPHGGKGHGVEQAWISWQGGRTKHRPAPLDIAKGHDMGDEPARCGRAPRCNCSREPVHGKRC
jgi:hypothetical protein